MKKLLIACVLYTLLFNSTVWAGTTPLEGAWFFTDQQGPGSGMMLTRHGDRMMIALTTYDDAGKPTWYFAGGALVQLNNSTDALFRAPLRTVINGACLDCAYVPGQALEIGREVALRFTAQNEAMLTLDPDTSAALTRQVRKLNVGARAIPTDDFPDLSGDWLLAEPDSNQVTQVFGQRVVHFIRQSSTDSNELVYLSQVSGRDVELRCAIEHDRDLPRVGQCGLYYTQNSAQPFATVSGDHVDHESIVFQATQRAGTRIIAVRLEAAAAFDSQLPLEGAWFFEGEDGPGSGVVIARNGQRMMVVLTTYDSNGDPTWYFSSGELQLGTEAMPVDIFSSTLYQVVDGSCLDCPFEPGRFEPLNRDIEIRFDSPTHGEVQLNPGAEQQRFSIRRLNVGPRALMGDPLPDLSGDWIFASVTPGSVDSLIPNLVLGVEGEIPTVSSGNRVVRYHGIPFPGRTLDCVGRETIASCDVYSFFVTVLHADPEQIDHRRIILNPVYSERTQVIGIRLPEW